MGLLITFEGGDGSGKSTQATLFYQRLKAEGQAAFAIPSEKVVLTHEPGGTSFGEMVGDLIKRRATFKWVQRQLLEINGERVDPRTELLLFEASRAQLVAEVIDPTLGQGGVVICDRFTDSTLAYQGYGRGLDLSFIRALNCFAAQDLKPDLTILLDIPVEVALSRKVAPPNKDRLGAEQIAFHERVRHGYLTLAIAEPQRWFMVDGTLPPERIARQIWERAEAFLER